MGPVESAKSAQVLKSHEGKAEAVGTSEKAQQAVSSQPAQLGNLNPV